MQTGMGRELGWISSRNPLRLAPVKRLAPQAVLGVERTSSALSGVSVDRGSTTVLFIVPTQMTTGINRFCVARSDDTLPESSGEVVSLNRPPGMNGI